jgi:formiminotetrahydrofolate cyclodeaminase
MTETIGFSQHSIQDFLNELAAKKPAPGGGAAAPVCGAIAAALANMVVAYSIGRKNLLEHREAHEQAGERLLSATRRFQALAEEDAVAYMRLNELQKLPDGDPRLDELAEVKRYAIAAPTQVVALCVEMLEVCVALAPVSNKFLLSDLAIAAILLEACARSSRWNVLVNAGDDAAPVEAVDVMLARAADLNARVQGACRPA